MSSASNNVASNSKKSNASSEHFEALESRQLMSASLTHLATPGRVEVREAVHANLNHGKLPMSPSFIITTPIRFPIHLPDIFIEPKVDSAVMSWKNVSSDPLFAPGGPSPADVIQNQVGDCWFLASLAETAKVDPSRIESLVSERADGTYDVRFHTSPTATIDEHVDGLLPLNSWGGLEYAQLGQNNCTWVAIMEKGLTYFRNRSIPAAYSTIGGGSGYEAYSDLGATPTEVLSKVSNATQLFDDVVWGLIFNTAIDFGTNGSAGPLVNGHEYSVISVQVVGGVDEIEVRNPWGYNPNFVANKNGYGATNNGYMWVSASSVLPELDEFVTANV